MSKFWVSKIFFYVYFYEARMHSIDKKLQSRLLFIGIKLTSPFKIIIN